MPYKHGVFGLKDKVIQVSRAGEGVKNCNENEIEGTGVVVSETYNGCREI